MNVNILELTLLFRDEAMNVNILELTLLFRDEI